MNSRTRTVLIAVVLGLIVALVVVALADTASAYESTEATPCPTAVVNQVKHARQAALTAWRADNRARACYERKARVRPPALPARAESEAAWTDARSHYRSLAHQYRAEAKALRHRMTHPGGSSNGVRWKPLARWCGWPEYALGQLAAIMMRESSGRERALSATNDRGLMQINACNAGTWQRVMHCSYWSHAFVAECNLRFALYLFRLQHDSFYPAWAP